MNLKLILFCLFSKCFISCSETQTISKNLTRDANKNNNNISNSFQKHEDQVLYKNKVDSKNFFFKSLNTNSAGADAGIK